MHDFTTTRKFRRVLRRLAKLGCHGFDWLAAREDEAKVYKANIEDGKIGIIRCGRDCDGVQYRHSGVRPAVPYRVWLKEQEHHESWLDGPESYTFVRPSDLRPEDDYSRDLVMEAYENGHPHVLRP